MSGAGHPAPLGEGLRQRAEERTRHAAPATAAKAPPTAAERTQHMLHELHVHQIELELQNEELRRAQEELEQSRARYFDLYELAPVGYVTLSAKGLILEANLTAAGLLGEVRSHLAKVPLGRFVCREDHAAYLRYRKQLAQPHPPETAPTGPPQSCELRMQRKDGAVVWVRLTAAAAHGAPGAELFRVVLEDVTSRRKAEEDAERSRAELARQNDVLTALLQNLTVGVFMVEAPSGRPLAANRAACELLGRGVLPDASASNLVEVYEAYQGKRSRAIRYPVEKMPITLGMQGICAHVDDLTVVRPDGTERRLEVFGSPVKDAQGRVWASLVSFQDITERARVEHAVRDSEQRYRRLFEMESDALFLIDGEGGRILDVNPAAATLYGYTRDEFLAKQSIEMSAEPELSRALIEKGKAAGGAVLRVPLVHHRKKDGSIFPTEISGQFFQLKGRQVLLAAVRDITERRKAEELQASWSASLERRVEERTAEVAKYARRLQELSTRLSNAEETERQRIVDVLHEDLQQILVAARMKLNALAERFRDAATRESVGTVSGMLTSALQLTRSLVQESAVPGVRDGDLTLAIGWLAEQLRARFSLAVRTVFPPAPRRVRPEVYLCLYRAVQELLFNVAKHAKVSEVVVELAHEGSGHLQITVSDQGCGIPADALDDGGMARSGFGLFNIHERIEAVGGRMRIASSEGKGTKVVLSAPAPG